MLLTELADKPDFFENSNHTKYAFDFVIRTIYCINNVDVDYTGIFEDLLKLLRKLVYRFVFLLVHNSTFSTLSSRLRYLFMVITFKYIKSVPCHMFQDLVVSIKELF